MHQFSNQQTEVHLWKYDLKKVPIDLSSATDYLSADEQYRANAFKQETDKRRYILVHLFVRDVLSKYTSTSKKDIKFSVGRNKKPFLIQNVNDPPVYFNLSYRGDQALLGISNNDCLGVDIEKIRTIDNIDSFLEDYFSRKEIGEIQNITDDLEKLFLVFRFWTMKESVIKALAIGFNQTLPQYDLSCFLAQTAFSPDFDSANIWQIHEIKVNENYKAAIAIKSNSIELSIFDYA